MKKIANARRRFLEKRLISLRIAALLHSVGLLKCVDINGATPSSRDRLPSLVTIGCCGRFHEEIWFEGKYWDNLRRAISSKRYLAFKGVNFAIL
jgi:hypothetical protein